MSAATSRPAGICYAELPAPDLEKAQGFYGSVFGWTFKPSKDYVAFKIDAEGIEGGFDPDLPVAEGGAVLYLEVGDIPAALKAVAGAGGRVLEEKTGIGEHGFVAYFRDPNGNRMGLWSKT